MGPGCWWSIGILWALLTVGCVIYVWNDCHRGNRPGVIWTIATIVFGVFAMIAYMIFKAFLPDRGWRG
jgi:hypothetical protein